MKPVLFPMALALALGACDQRAATGSTPVTATAPAASAAPGVASVASAGAPGCNARAEGAWSASQTEIFTIEAIVWGPTCDQAAAALAFRHADGPPVYTYASAAADLIGFGDAVDAAAIQAPLASWIAGSGPGTTSRLPEWKEGDPAPDPDAEFPFYPDADVDRASYNMIRSKGLPMFCFAQGQESSQCVVLDVGSIQNIGVQQFPG